MDVFRKAAVQHDVALSSVCQRSPALLKFWRRDRNTRLGNSPTLKRKMELN